MFVLPQWSQPVGAYAHACLRFVPPATVQDVSATEPIKTPVPAVVEAPGGDETYSFAVINPSSGAPVALESLVDTVLGDLNGQGTCALPQTIAAGGSYSCQVTVTVSGNAGDSVTNVASAAVWGRTLRERPPEVST